MRTSAGSTALAVDFAEVGDVTVIGAGPVGMCTAFWAGMRETSSRVIDSVASQAVHEIRPETKIQPKYSTNTGVPGVVAGQP